MTRARPEVLFTSPFQPLGPRHGDGFSCSANGAFQLTWGQEGFRAEDLMWHWGLDLIAENLEARSVVLQFPTWRRFVREVRRAYPLVGITFNICTLHRVRRMVEAVRRHSPGSRVVLGGYGTMLPDEALVDGLGRPLADFVCREEGIGYMRRLLGERDAPVRQPLVAMDRRLLSVRTGERTGVVFSSVGCPNGCDFCATSHYFHRRQVRFLAGGREVHRAMAAQRAADPRITSFTVLDEDFLTDPARGRELLASVQESGEVLDVMVFSSLRSLLPFSGEDLLRMGISRVWIGVEAEKAGYGKLLGRDFAAQVEELRRCGINTVASVIVGYDYQDRATIEAEFERVLAAAPTVIQVLLFTPCAGTPAWERLEREGRLREDLRADYPHHDGFRLLFRHPRLGADELEGLQRALSREEYRRLGPSVFRFVRTAHEGWTRLKDSADPYLRRVAAASRERLARSLVLYPAGILFAPTPEVRRTLRDDFARLRRDVGPLTLGRWLASALLVLLYPLAWYRFRFERFTQPGPTRTVYPGRRRAPVPPGEGADGGR